MLYLVSWYIHYHRLNHFSSALESTIHYRIWWPVNSQPPQTHHSIPQHNRRDTTNNWSRPLRPLRRRALDLHLGWPSGERSIATNTADTPCPSVVTAGGCRTALIVYLHTRIAVVAGIFLDFREHSRIWDSTSGRLLRVREITIIFTHGGCVNVCVCLCVLSITTNKARVSISAIIYA